MKLIVLFLVFFSVCYCSPVHKFEEAEYEITLKKTPGEKTYFIKRNELPLYEQQFAKIKELGDEISCKITGNCQGKKRGLISKKSMLDMDNAESASEYGDTMNAEAMIGTGGSIGGEDVSKAMNEDKTSNFMAAGQSDAPLFGQQPQMDIKMSEKEMAAMQGGFGSFSAPNPMGGGPGGASPVAGMPNGGGPPSIDGNDALMKMTEQHNSQVIDNSIQDKVNFMDKANGPRQPGNMEMPGAAPSMTDPLNQLPHPAEAKDDTPSNAPGGVSENDLLKAEDIQPNEMKGIDSFLKDSNRVEKSNENAGMINENPDENNLGKTNVDFGESHASIENNEPNNEKGDMSPPAVPGGPEVPTLNNLGLGMGPEEMGPPGASPNLKFIQDNTRQMIQQNSDYKVPQPALSSLWNSYMSSTQSVLGEKDPSANSRQSISRPDKRSNKLHRRSNKKSRKSQ